jgi:DNA-binding LacI/PurR family transcriptional regulator
MMIGVLVPDLANPVFVPFLRGVQHVAQSHGYVVLVVDAQRSAEIERRALDRLQTQGADLLLLAGPVRDKARVEELRRTGMVVADPDHLHGFRRPLVPVLERPGTWAMCDALADLGHRRLAYVNREDRLGEAGRRRWQAMSLRCRALGVETERLVLGRAREPAEVAELLAAVLRRPEPVTALVSSAHGLAPTVLRGLHAAGVELPGDCSFVTFGDSEWAEAYRPAISVVTLDLYEVAVAVTTASLRELGREPVAGVERPGSARFLLRGSAGRSPVVEWSPSRSAKVVSRPRR